MSGRDLVLARIDNRDDVAVVLDAELAGVRAQEVRADAKAFSLLALDGAALVATTGGLLSGRVGVVALALGLVAGTALAGAAALLGRAIWPRLGGSFGFIRWAGLVYDRDVALTIRDDLRSVDPLAQAGGSLRWLSAGLVGKYVAIQWALLFMALALGAAGAAVVITLAGGGLHG